MKRLPLTLSLFFFALFTVLGQKLLGDADTLWHIKTGEAIVTSLSFPQFDSFSFSMQNKQWIAKEWLSQVLLYIGNLGGFTTLLLEVCSVIAIIIYLITKEVERFFSQKITFFIILIVIGLSLSSFNARPHLFALLPFVIITIGLLRANEQNKSPSFWLLMPFWAWVNLHGSFLIGFIIIAFFGLEAVVESGKEERIKTFKSYFLFGLAALLISFINPYGWRTYEAAFAVLNLGEAKFLITEWMKPSFAPPLWGEILIFAALLFAAIKIKFPLLRIIFICVFLHLAFSASRHSAIAAIMIALLSSKPLAKYDRLSRENYHLPVLPLIFVALACVSFMFYKGVAPAKDTYPKTALAFLKQQSNARILNHYNFGGAMIYEELKTFIDGRTELYGEQFFLDYNKAIYEQNENVFNKIVADNKINTLFLPIGFKDLKYMNNNSSWKQIYHDEESLIFQKQ